MDVKEMTLSIVFLLIIWFVFGFVTFLIEAKRTQDYKTFDETAQRDCLSITLFRICKAESERK